MARRDRTAASPAHVQTGHWWRFAKDRTGLAGIEFALVLPLMLLLVAGVADLGLGLMVDRKINQIATITSDVVAQENGWTESELDSLLGGAAAILTPFDSGELKIVVSVLDFDSAGNGSVNWSRAYQTSALDAGTAWPDAISADVIETGVQMVITEVDYRGSTAVTGLLSALTGVESYGFSAKAMARPRVGDTVAKN